LHAGLFSRHRGRKAAFAFGSGLSNPMRCTAASFIPSGLFFVNANQPVLTVAQVIRWLLPLHCALEVESVKSHTVSYPICSGQDIWISALSTWASNSLQIIITIRSKFVGSAPASPTALHLCLARFNF